MNGTAAVRFTVPVAASPLGSTTAPAVVSLTPTATGASVLPASGGANVTIGLRGSFNPSDVLGMYLVALPQNWTNATTSGSSTGANSSSSSSSGSTGSCSGSGSGAVGMTPLAAALAAAVPCAAVTWQQQPSSSSSASASVAVCTTGPMPPGSYQAMVVLNGSSTASGGSSAAASATAGGSSSTSSSAYNAQGLTLLSSGSVSVDLSVTSVSPAAGSVGGGTLLTLTGFGFVAAGAINSTDAIRIFVTVPVSGTFPTGLLPCDVVSATATQLMCRTRPHLAATADLDDPLAAKRLPKVTPAAAVVVMLCRAVSNNASANGGSGTGSTSAGPSASLPSTCPFGTFPVATSRCTVSNGCRYAYTTAATPVLGYVLPSAGGAGTRITIVGRGLTGATTARFFNAASSTGTGAASSSSSSSGAASSSGSSAVAQASCSLDAATPPAVASGSAGGVLTAVACDVPAALRAGRYSLVVELPSGSMSLDPYQVLS